MPNNENNIVDESAIVLSGLIAENESLRELLEEIKTRIEQIIE